ncbi:50S ribosomal protein L15 [Blattabacterium cuenoti]|uniref:50S ribosomal protein L15 n=1 Tax=Blattabacterium cuenoti TaxID=1653831 RepID=UPI00163BB4A0|nr:50S ribosomal protein L15 [Blattabacterium cuenoti]
MDNNNVNYCFLKSKNWINKKKIRLGRGQGSGKGGTCGRGHKGYKSRSGYSKKIGFEGGQMPIQRRIPKFGFKRKNFAKKTILINVDTIQHYIDIGKINKNNVINKETLFKNKFLKKNYSIKILGRGKINSSVKIQAEKFSKNASESIKNSGGTPILI